MRDVYWAGARVGRMFVKEFPGIQKMLRALADIFSSKRFRPMMKSVTDEFSKFFKMLHTDPKAGFASFMKNMKKIFFDFFTKGTPAGERFLSGLKDFYKTVGIIMVAGIKTGLGAMKELLKGIIDFVKNPSSLVQGATGIGTGLKGMFIEAFQYLAVELGPLLKDVGGLFVDLLTTLYKKFIAPHIKTIVFSSLAFFFGPALVLGFVRGITAALLGHGVPAIIGMLRKSGRAAETVAAGPEAGVVGAQPTDPGTMADRVMKSAKGMAKMAGAIVLFTLAVSSMVAAIIGLAYLAKKAKVTPAEMILMTGVFGAVSLMVYGLVKSGFFEALAWFGEVVRGAGIGKVAGALALALGAIGAVLVGIAGVVVLSAKMLSLVSEQQIKTTLYVFGAMSLMLLGLTGVVAVLAGVGTAMATYGSYVAVAVVAGLVTLGAVMFALTQFAKTTVVDFASTMTRNGITNERAKTIVGLFGSVIEMVVSLSTAMSLLALSAPFLMLGSLLSLFRAGPFDALRDIVRIIGSSIKDIITSLKDVGGDVNVLRAKAEVFSAIATGLGALIEPVTAVIGSVSGVFSGLLNPGAANTVRLAAASMTRVITVISGVLPPLINQVKSIAENMTVSPEKFKTAAEVFSAVSTGVGGIITAVAEVLKTFEGASGAAAFNPLSAVTTASTMVAKLKALTSVTSMVLPRIREVIRADG